ncbi:MAG: ethanolamine ammonia-lyase subunit EutC [Hydrogenophaga sp.]|nr:ethanolamine ammonia-lyase subunit EutC [Hydrogenophaga sp.]
MPVAVQTAGWDSLRRFTDARIALGRAGHSQPTAAHLAFQLAHAQARDAVHLPLDLAAMADRLRTLGLAVLPAHSAATDRATYLQRPDLGRQLDDVSARRLADRAGDPVDLAVVIADGLSALGVMQNAVPLLTHLLPLLRADPVHAWTMAPVVLVAQGRVAIGDPVGDSLRARTVVVLIGERPGLSSPDSLGIYFTWSPRVGMSDAQRNCISNVRDAGLSPERAAVKLHHLLSRARALQLSGVNLKDDVDDSLPAKNKPTQLVKP